MTENTAPQNSDIIIYTSNDGHVKVEVMFQDGSFWMSQKKLADLFRVHRSVISKHLESIFKEKELISASACLNVSHIDHDGKSYNTSFYNLDAVIAVGYRVTSYHATQFRIWATQALGQYISKGFVLDSERLKNGEPFGHDYFKELQERIQEIRASERRFYLKLTDLYEQCSIDYDRNSVVTKNFFNTVQNTLHSVITGKTASELILERAKAEEPNMGLQTWKNAPEGKVLKSDVSVADNYLDEKEMKDFESAVNLYLDYAENQALQQVPMKMTDWVKKLEVFLQINDYEILVNSDILSFDAVAAARVKAESEYEVFRLKQDRLFISDFDKAIEALNQVSDTHKD